MPTVVRPPGIEAFLPISSLISLKYWLATGIFNHVHPSGLIIFSMALVTGLLLKRGGSLVARITGSWQTSISTHEYLFHVRHLDMPFYQHNRGQVPAYNKEAWLRMMNEIRKAGEKRGPS